MRNELFKWSVENKNLSLQETSSPTEYASLNPMKTVNEKAKSTNLSYVNYDLVEKHHEVRRLR